MTRSLVWRFRGAAHRAFPAFCLLLTQCVSSYEVLGSGGEGGSGGSGGSAGTGQGGGAGFSDCYEALALGKTGDPCTGTFKCQTDVSTQRDCCHPSAACSAGTLTITVNCDPCPCSVDQNCGQGAWCIDGLCQPCRDADECLPPDFGLVARNGCYYCVHRNFCRRDSDCETGQRCYPGPTCFAGCPQGDPSCCYGNRCAPAACGEIASFDCSLVGCPDGKYCHIVDFEERCICLQNFWDCTEPSNTCVPL